MKIRVIPLLLVLSLAALAAVTQTPANPDERIVAPRRTQAPAAPPHQPEAAPAPAAADQQEAAALRADLAHMRVLLNQMRTNLAFVQNTDTPLKHQFTLNNEMWDSLLSDMERRLQRLEHPPAKAGQ
jgi:hypothetical protein